MGRINLRSLIDEVLEMVKNKQNEDRKLRSDQELARVNQSWDDTPAGQVYWKDIRGRNTDMEKQGLVNQGALGLARENNAGQLARQSLANIGNENVANINAGASRYGSELGLRGNEITAKATVDAAQATVDAAQGKDKGEEKGFAGLIGKVIDADPGILTDTKRLNETVSNIRTFFPPQRGASSEFYRAPQPAANVVPQAGLRTPQKPAITMPTLPARQPAPAAQSMEFASDDVLRKRKMAERNKIVEEQMFGPKKDKGFFSSLF